MPIFELARVIPVKSHVWKFGSDWLSLSRVIVVTDRKKKNGLNVIKTGGIWIFLGGGQKTPIRWGYMWPAMPIFELGWAIPVKICENLVRIGWAFQELSFEFPGRGRNTLLGGLHVACNAHFRTWPSYSSQKSCVKIWFGLVEPFKSYRIHKHFSGGRDPHYGGYIWPVMPIFELGCAIPVKSHVLKFGLDWLKSEVC